MDIPNIPITTQDDSSKDVVIHFTAPDLEALRLVRLLYDMCPCSSVVLQLLDDDKFRVQVWNRVSADLQRHYLIMRQAQEFLDRWESSL